jgi:pimeloyl-ACP methyl ester carboxylesterase
MLLWCVMSPVKVLEEEQYRDRKLVAFISDRFKLVPMSDHPVTHGANWSLMVSEGIWSPQAMAASTSRAGKAQLVFLPVRHDNLKASTDTVDTAVRENLDTRLHTAANLLWSMNYISTATPTLNYEEDFVIAGYSAGGFNMWSAAQKNLDKMKALIAIEPVGIAYPDPGLKTVVDTLIRQKRKIFFVGRYKTVGDMGAVWKARDGQQAGITYMPTPSDYDSFFAYKPLTTTNEWLKYIFTGLKKRDDEEFEKNADNKEPHAEPDISLDERQAINRLGLKTDSSFASVISSQSWFGIPVLHLFAMCGGRVFTPAKLNSKGIVITDAEYKTFYQECMEAL